MKKTDEEVIYHDGYWLADEPAWKVAVVLLINLLVIILFLPIGLVALGLNKCIEKIFEKWT